MRTERNLSLCVGENPASCTLNSTGLKGSLLDRFTRPDVHVALGMLWEELERCGVPW